MTTYMVGYSTPPRRLTFAELEQRRDWYMLDPEFRRRLIAMFDASNGTVGIGGGWRSAEAQRQLFLTRYYPDPDGSVSWDGRRWSKRSGVASAAPPGRSYHEETTRDGKALAADLIGDLNWVGVNAGRFGLHDFSDVNDEPWHVQPVEIPNSRTRYTGAPLPAWQLEPPTQPSPQPQPLPPSQPNQEEDEMPPVRVRFQGFKNVFLFTSGGYTHLTEVLSPYFERFPLVVSDAHPQGLKCALAQSGLEHTDLVPTVAGD